MRRSRKAYDWLKISHSLRLGGSDQLMSISYFIFILYDLRIEDECATIGLYLMRRCERPARAALSLHQVLEQQNLNEM